ncbi:MAG TPA: hypothetical protein PKJ28_04605 [Bacteroidales bacterium]|nr:hypothetical protein [Bacteroidales bacterium]HPS73803.1 hypothetical protein [Bacteroidales bacterium]
MKLLKRILLLVLLVSCNFSDEISGDEIIAKYLKDQFNVTMDKGTIIFINTKGCPVCAKAAYDYLLVTPGVMNSYRYLILSGNFYEKYASNDSAVGPKVLVDSSNLIERLNVPFQGVSIVRFNQGKMDSISMLNPEILEMGLENFFK